jgi:hypothetical protein
MDGQPWRSRKGRWPVDWEKLKAALKGTFDKIFAQKELESRLLEKAAHANEGYGRLDALNRIGNQVFFTNFLDKKTGALPDPILEENFARHDAPVSFPPIWGTPFFLWAQYDASVLNELARNAGEALGVNAKINMTAPASGRPLFGSSIDMLNIHRFEQMLRGSDPFKAPFAKDRKFDGLVAPQWKDVQAKFPEDKAWATNDELVDKGRELYRAHCFECHRGPVNDAKFDQKWKEDSFWESDNPDRKAKNEKNWVEIEGRHYSNVAQVPVATIGTDRQQSRVLTERRVHLPASLGVAAIADLNKRGTASCWPKRRRTCPSCLRSWLWSTGPSGNGSLPTARRTMCRKRCGDRGGIARTNAFSLQLARAVRERKGVCSPLRRTTARVHSMAFGRRRLICTMARCRRWQACCCRKTSGQRNSVLAVASSIPPMSAW